MDVELKYIMNADYKIETIGTPNDKLYISIIQKTLETFPLEICDLIYDFLLWRYFCDSVQSGKSWTIKMINKTIEYDMIIHYPSVTIKKTYETIHIVRRCHLTDKQFFDWLNMEKIPFDFAYRTSFNCILSQMICDDLYIQRL